MDREILSILIVESSKLLSSYLRSRPVSLPQTGVNFETLTLKATPTDYKQATQAATGCLPCSISHLGTCSGLLNEAMRFARSDGMTSAEVTTRMNQCLDELNTMERVDLRPELIVELPAWQKELAEKALVISRSTRHNLENLITVGELEEVAADTQKVRNEIGSAYLTTRIKQMNPQEQAELKARVVEKAKEIKQRKTP